MYRTTKPGIIIIAIALLIAPHVVAQYPSTGTQYPASLTIVSPDEQILTSLIISPRYAEIGEGESIQFAVQAFDQYSRPMEVPVIYSVLDKNIGTINATGYFTALEQGNTKVIVLYDSPAGKTLYDTSIVSINKKQNGNIIKWLEALLQVIPN